MDEAVPRIHGFARTQRNCVASSAALRLEKKSFLAMSSLRSTPQAGKCAVPNLQPAVPGAPLRWKCRGIVDLFSWLPEGFRGIELYQRAFICHSHVSSPACELQQILVRDIVSK